MRSCAPALRRDGPAGGAGVPPGPQGGTGTALASWPGSRAAADELLAGLRREGWGPRAAARFLGRAALRSLVQARARPRAMAELAALHALLMVLGEPGRRRWVAVPWALAAAHTGMLEQRSSIGLANAITLTRANLPVLEHRLGGWLPVLALASDFLDGRLARASCSESAFGASADALSDIAFWAWFTLTHEPSRRARVAALAVWAAPALTVAALSVARGRMVDAPRPALLRPYAAMQVILTARALDRCAGRRRRSRP